MAPFVERRYVFTGNGVFVCKTNVGQHHSDEQYEETTDDYGQGHGLPAETA
jgi:hypothetical protein